MSVLRRINQPSTLHPYGGTVMRATVEPTYTIEYAIRDGERRMHERRDYWLGVAAAALILVLVVAMYAAVSGAWPS